MNNYLYHSVGSAATTKEILKSGRLNAKISSRQPATVAQVGSKVPTVSFGRNLSYQLDGDYVGKNYQVVLVIDRNALEKRYRTIATSQSRIVKGLAYGTDFSGPGSSDKLQEDHPELRDLLDKRVADGYNILDINKDGEICQGEIKANIDAYTKYYANKAGDEFEEAVPVKKGFIPLKDILVGFYLVPGKPASEDPELLNHPLRLEMTRPNVFVKVNQQ
jgi:hypothetical protein